MHRTNRVLSLVGGVLAIFVFALYLPMMAKAATNTWSSARSLATARQNHTAVLLPSSSVVVAGGNADGTGPLASAELYDPVTNAWSAAGSLANARTDHTATLLPCGQVLVTGGYCSAIGADIAVTRVKRYTVLISAEH